MARITSLLVKPVVAAIASLLLTVPAGFAATPGTLQVPGPLQVPGTLQTPGTISVPKGTLQTPGTLQIPHGLQAVKETTDKCAQRLSVVADALFAFNKSTLAPAAEETLIALVPLIEKAGKHPVSIEGHTDAIGSATYNQRLSENRAKSVKDWLVARKAVDSATSARGFGKTRPVAPNSTSDGRDDPEGRQKNRRVEIVINTCN